MGVYDVVEVQVELGDPLSELCSVASKEFGRLDFNTR